MTITVEDFEKVQREVAEQIREYEKAYPDFVHPPYTGDEVVRQPIYSYDLHATGTTSTVPPVVMVPPETESLDLLRLGLVRIG